MIKSLKHNGLKKFYESGNKAGIKNNHNNKLRIQLTALNTAIFIEDVDLPGFRLHSLKGKRKGLWAIDISKNWRIVFRFDEGSVYVVDYEDYH
ncbi:HigB toxin protein [Candidatus Scalindua japonica]|uniref:HigB toxin protein n=1 Tax=Candidatus Scalindua japonica TaxID=1284222 RepID=A0A286TU33_9BACT|nr:type II toxin-antitoxin system RelE/ParE family toxin [Candidatus Scalindua japonica]GAX59361.1 HigB toxin protein [Candidatus Scalindua japonica]